MFRLVARILPPFAMFAAIVALWHFIFHRAITVAIATLPALPTVTP